MRPRSASDSYSASLFTPVNLSTGLFGEKAPCRPNNPSLAAVASFRKRPVYLSLLAICIGILIANVIFRLAVLRHGTIIYEDFHHYLSNQLISAHRSHPQDAQLLAGTKPLIVALVSFSARSRTELLNCYLQQNLAQNGGLIDRVIFTSETNEYEELEWLKTTVSQVDGYNMLITDYFEFDEANKELAEKLIPLYEAATIKRSLGKSWKLADLLSSVMKQPVNQPDPLWLFINSETIYLSPDMVTSLVYTHQTQPEFSLVQANVINQQALSWVHSKLGTTKPYRPEGGYKREQISADSSSDGLATKVFDNFGEQDKNTGIEERAWPDSSWKASELPLWPAKDIAATSPSADSAASPMLFGVPVDFQPRAKHRWLPFDARASSDPSSAAPDQLDFRQRPSISSPITQNTFTSVGPGKWPWTLFAQRLYSFLEHLEEDLSIEDDASASINEQEISRGTRGLARYQFPLWSYEREPIELSLFLVSSADIHAATLAPGGFPYDADEAELGRWILRDEVAQKRLNGRGAVVDGHAIAARFAPAEATSLGTPMDDSVGKALEKTDLLERFQAYGQEVGCRARHRSNV